MTIAVATIAPTRPTPASAPLMPAGAPTMAVTVTVATPAAAKPVATQDALHGGRIVLIPIGGRGDEGYSGGGYGFPSGGMGRLPGGLGRIPGGMMQQPDGPTPRDPQPGEREAFESNIHKVQDFWTRMGVGADEGNGRELPVQFLDNYPNASYAHSRDGSKESFNIGLDKKSGESYATATDVIAHEYAHRVVNHILGQQGIGEAGAVNESLADTFACAVDPKNWTIGEDIRPGGIRTLDKKESREIDLPDAGVVTLPINMRDYVDTQFDKGGVHINVGIPNKAASMIGDSIGRDNMAHLYLDAIRDFMPKDGMGGIADLANATLQASQQRFGASSKETQAVNDAWTAVGVLGGAASGRDARPSGFGRGFVPGGFRVA